MPEPAFLTPNVAVCGQLAPRDLADVAKRGFRVIVNNRPDGEAWIGQPRASTLDQAAAVAGIVSHHITFTMPTLTAAHAQRLNAVLDSAEGAGSSTAIGHARALTAADAALVKGTAAHGEDYDDTFEGGPVHAGAVVVPAVLAAAERFGLSGADAFAGIAVGSEATCRRGRTARLRRAARPSRPPLRGRSR